MDDHQSSPTDKEEKPANAVHTAAALEPRVVVIMAGDDHPTYIARPSAQDLTSCNHQQQEV